MLSILATSDIFLSPRRPAWITCNKFFFWRCSLYILMKVITLFSNFPGWFSDWRLAVTVVLGLRVSLNLLAIFQPLLRKRFSPFDFLVPFSLPCFVLVWLKCLGAIYFLGRFRTTAENLPVTESRSIPFKVHYWLDKLKSKSLRIPGLKFMNCQNFLVNMMQVLLCRLGWSITPLFSSKTVLSSMKAIYSNESKVLNKYCFLKKTNVNEGFKEDHCNTKEY